MKIRNKKLLGALCAALVIFFVVLLFVVIALSHHNVRLPQRSVAQHTPSFSEQLTGAQANDINQNVAREIKKSKQDLGRQIDVRLKAIETEIKSGHKQVNVHELRQSIENELSSELEGLKARIETLKTKAKDTVRLDGGQLPVGGAESDPTSHSVVWIEDVSLPKEDSKVKGLGKANPFASGFNAFDDKVSNDKDQEGSLSDQVKKKKVIPFYTIPPNSVMTGVIALQPMVGQIPRGNDHSVFRAFHTLFVTEHPTLMAQGHEAPIPVARMMGTAVCVGDFVSESVMCEVESLTFIFPDGHFQVVNYQSKNPTSQSEVLNEGIGTLTDIHGNPQIYGQLKTSVGLRLALRGATAGISAYGEGLSQAQVSNNSTSLGVTQQILNANKYAQGKFVSGLANGAQDELNDLAKNMFDYVFVPNWNPTTHKMVRLNIMVRQQINIDFDENARKINYGNSIEAHTDHIIL